MSNEVDWVLTDSDRRELLELFDENLSPGRLRPNPVNLARCLFGQPPSKIGSADFGDIGSDHRRRSENDGPSDVAVVLGRAEDWISHLEHGKWPIGVLLGCFPAGIHRGCRKHLECPQEVETTCELKSGPAAEELKVRRPVINAEGKRSGALDPLPVLRLCPYLGCVRREDATDWLMTNLLAGETDPVAEFAPLIDSLLRPGDTRDRREQLRDVVDRLMKALTGVESPEAFRTQEALPSFVRNGSLDALCPHIRRAWTVPAETLQAGSDEPHASANNYRFVQCSIARPWSIDGPNGGGGVSLDRKGQPTGLCSTFANQEALRLPDGFAETPLRWYRRSGFSGVGVIVIDERGARTESGQRDSQRVYYLQMGSSIPMLRDYYEAPHFWLGESIGAGKRASSEPMRHVTLQSLFRAQRAVGEHFWVRRDERDRWKPDVMRLFSSSAREALASPGGNRELVYCPDGEMSLHLLIWRILRTRLPPNSYTAERFALSLDAEFTDVISKEVFGGQESIPGETLENLLGPGFSDPAKANIFQDLDSLGLLDTSSDESRLTSLVQWLEHLADCQADNDAAQGSYTPMSLLEHGTWASTVARCYKTRPNMNMDFPRWIAQTAPGMPPIADTNADTLPAVLLEVLNACVAAVLEKAAGRSEQDLAEEWLAELFTDEARFPLPAYYAWRRSGTGRFRLGHLGAPIGRSNPISSSEDEILPWSESEFFLAGVDEDLIAGKECPSPRYSREWCEKFNERLHANLSLARAVFAPLADATIDYTIFQHHLLSARANEHAAATARAHQLNNLLAPADSARDVLLDGSEPQRIAAAEYLAAVIAQASIENRLALTLATNKIQPIDAPLNIDAAGAIRDVVRRFLDLISGFGIDDGRTQSFEGPSTASRVMVVLSKLFLDALIWEVLYNFYRRSEDWQTVAVGVETAHSILMISVRSAGTQNLNMHGRGYGLGTQIVKSRLAFLNEFAPDLEAYKEVARPDSFETVLSIDLRSAEKKLRELEIIGRGSDAHTGD